MKLGPDVIIVTKYSNTQFVFIIGQLSLPMCDISSKTLKQL